MTDKIIFSAIIAVVLGGYAAMLYAFVHIVVLVNHSYLMNLAL